MNKQALQDATDGEMSSADVTCAFTGFRGQILAISDAVLVVTGIFEPKVYFVPFTALPCPDPIFAATYSFLLKEQVQQAVSFHNNVSAFRLGTIRGTGVSRAVFSDNGLQMYFLLRNEGQFSTIVCVHSNDDTYTNIATCKRFLLYPDLSDCEAWLTYDRELMMVTRKSDSTTLQYHSIYLDYLVDIAKYSVVPMSVGELEILKHTLSRDNGMAFDEAAGRIVLTRKRDAPTAPAIFTMHNRRVYLAKFMPGADPYCIFAVRDLLSGRGRQYRLELPPPQLMPVPHMANPFLLQAEHIQNLPTTIKMIISRSEERMVVHTVNYGTFLVSLDENQAIDSLEEKAAELCWDFLKPEFRVLFLKEIAERGADSEFSGIDFTHFCCYGRLN